MQKRELEPVTKEMISKVMAQIGRNGGRIGGKRAMARMTPEQRLNFSRQGNRARWKKQKAAAGSPA